MFQLRDYQSELAHRTRHAFKSSPRVLMVLATGGGKTVIFAHVTASAAAKGNRVIVVAHRTEIVGQISRALDEMGVRHGRIQPGHKPTDDAVQVAMIQTLARRQQTVPSPDLLVIDEAHHCASESYDELCSLWPTAKILGVTATPQRLDGRGLGRLFGEMVIGPDPGELIRNKWLAPYLYLAPPSQVDLSGIRTRAGDYALDEVALAMDRAVITGDAIGHYQKHLAPRSAIVFCVRVDHAEHVAQQFADAGISASSVDGSMDRATRADRIGGLGDGRYKIVTSCALISEGLDVPSVGGVILLRPTKSLALHLQQIGRALRPKPDGSAAIVLDHVGNVHRHGLPDAPRNWTLDEKKRKPHCDPVGQCKVCFRIFPTGPGWRAAVDDPCDTPHDPDCILSIPSGGMPHEPPAVVDGQLALVTTRPEWAKGCDILAARGAEFRSLISHAIGDEIMARQRLQEIQRARGYHPKWIMRVLLGMRP